MPSSNQAHFGSGFIQKVAGTITGTTALSIWTPATGKKVTLRGCALRARVTTALVGATPGDHVSIVDNAAATPLVTLGVIAAATDAVATNYGFTYFDLAGGYTLAAANNVLKIATGATIGAGVIAINGFVWGNETG